MRVPISALLALLVRDARPASAFAASPFPPNAGASSVSGTRRRGVWTRPPFDLIRRGGQQQQQQPNGVGKGGGGLGVSTEAAAEESSSSAEEDAGPSDESSSSSDVDEELEAAIAAAAVENMSISGPHVRPSTFGSLPYVDTSSLSTTGGHRVLFVLGGPGAGKGTQSELMIENYKCVHLSVGELLRDERAKGAESPRGKLIEDCLVQGKIVPVGISLELLRDAMDDASKSPASDGNRYGARLFLVDGFPRNFDNLRGWTDDMPRSASAVGCLSYDCPDDVLEKRILERGRTSGRSDDNVESARKRFETFRTQTAPVVRALEGVEASQKAEGGNECSTVRVAHINGKGTIEEVWDLTREAVDGYVLNDVLSANAALMEAVNAGDAAAYAALCDAGMLVDEDEEDEDAVENEDEGGRIARIFEEYEVARLAPPEEDDEGSAPSVTVTQKHEVSNAEASIQDGTKAVVSYDRTMLITIQGEGEGEGGETVERTVRETRVWSHGEGGWKCVHFYRTPIEE